MRKILTIGLAAMLTGCSYGAEHLKTFVEDPLRDPHYAENQQKLADLESEYLAKKMTYAEYIEKKQELENQYEKEVKERNQKIQAE